MLHIHPFSPIFESSSLTPEQEDFLYRCVNGGWGFDPSTGKVDVNGSVTITKKSLERIGAKKIPVNFGRVSGNFHASYCSLRSLKGAPESTSTFYCDHNLLRSLEGAPREVRGNFNCNSNRLTSLKGAPRVITASFDCSDNLLTSLNGAPVEVRGDFNCSYNPLTNLKGAPRKVGGDLICLKVDLVSLEGAPEKVLGYFRFDEFSSEVFNSWGDAKWMDIFLHGSEKSRSLISTILNPSYINSQIEKDPEGMVMKLKRVWNDPAFSEIRRGILIPDLYREEMDTLGDLGELGF